MPEAFQSCPVLFLCGSLSSVPKRQLLGRTGPHGKAQPVPFAGHQCRPVEASEPEDGGGVLMKDFVIKIIPRIIDSLSVKLLPLIIWFNQVFAMFDRRLIMLMFGSRYRETWCHANWLACFISNASSTAASCLFYYFCAMHLDFLHLSSFFYPVVMAGLSSNTSCIVMRRLAAYLVLLLSRSWQQPLSSLAKVEFAFGCILN